MEHDFIGKSPLGELLLGAGLIVDSECRAALNYQKAKGGKLGAILVKMGFIEEDVLTMVLAEQQHLRVVDLEKYEIDPEAVRMVPREIIEKHEAVPIKYEDGTITLAMSDPWDYEALEETQFATNCKVQPVLAPGSAVQKALREVLDADVPELKLMTDEGPAPEAPETTPRDAPPPGSPTGHADMGAMEAALVRALIPLLVEKGIITERELVERARQERRHEVAEAGSTPE